MGSFKISKKLLGKDVVVVITDHAMGMPVIECRVFGKVVHVDDNQIVLRWWECVGMDTGDSNHENVSLVRSAITKLKILR